MNITGNGVGVMNVMGHRFVSITGNGVGVMNVMGHRFVSIIDNGRSVRIAMAHRFVSITDNGISVRIAIRRDSPKSHVVADLLSKYLALDSIVRQSSTKNIY